MKFINNKIGEGNPAYIIAEMSANHGGNMQTAKDIIKAAKDSGADCIKIQTYTADTMTIDSDNEYFQIHGGLWDGYKLYDLYEDAYTPWEWQRELKDYADEIEIDFLSTPFDKTSVDFLESIGVEAYKIASFELVDIPLIRYIASKNKPIMMSTGMASLAEIEEAVNTIKSQGNNDIILLKCASAYPAITDDMNLATIRNMAETFRVITGLSDHSMGSVGAVCAVAMGAKVIEKHFCLSRELKTPDSDFSMEPDEFKRMVKDVRQAELSIGKVQYGLTNQETGSIVFRRSIFAVKDIKSGENLTEDNIRVIRPGYGLKPKYYDDLLGQKALVDIARGTPIRFEMVGRQ